MEIAVKLMLTGFVTAAIGFCIFAAEPPVRVVMRTAGTLMIGGFLLAAGCMLFMIWYG